MANKKVKYILLTAENEPNIAVLSTQIPIQDDLKFIESIVGQLKIALMEHFDADVEVKRIDCRSFIPIQATAMILIGHKDEDEKYSMEISLNETWVY